ncbi:MAG: hypothetical protein RIM99_10245 [Cyclobacteriaceae bacterium]
MPGIFKEAEAVKEKILLQNGFTTPPSKPRFIEDIVETDIGDFQMPVDEIINETDDFPEKAESDFFEIRDSENEISKNNERQDPFDIN